jgi:E3 ubiquitin-protein ligase UBR7
MSSSLTELIASQDDLVAEAALALPHSFSHCTYPLGSLRQAVYLCLTCASPRGICSGSFQLLRCSYNCQSLILRPACSIACHTDHEQLELFPKRNFRCDCPTTALSHACTLHKTPEGTNERNSYGQNFRSLFCRCGRPYDPRTERETMIQCLACEVSAQIWPDF